MKDLRQRIDVEFYTIPDLCHCGCGQIVYHRGQQFVWGHHSEECLKQQSINMTGRYKGISNPKKRHPNKLKGKPGRSHTEKEKQHQAKIMIGRLVGKKYPERCGKNNHMYGRSPPHGTGHGKRSHYMSPLQGQVCFRSSYELAYAKYLDSIHELWMYEMETFDLVNTTYTPDFFLPRQEKFVEIKGYMTELGLQKINMFKEQYTWDLEVLGLQELRQIGVK